MVYNACLTLQAGTLIWCVNVVEHLGEVDAMHLMDETGFLKKGNKLVSEKRQYS